MNFSIGCIMAILIAFIVIVVVIFEPIIIIWSFNQLFYLHIITGFNTWFAVFFLQGVLFGGIKFPVNWWHKG